MTTHCSQQELHWSELLLGAIRPDPESPLHGLGYLRLTNIPTKLLPKTVTFSPCVCYKGPLLEVRR